MNTRDPVVPVILVMDRDPARLRATVSLLAAHGYATASAQSSGDAIHHLNEGLQPSVVLCESRLSRSTNFDLADTVHAVSPRTAIVVLEPPFEFEEVFPRIRVLLDAPTPPSADTGLDALGPMLPESGIAGWIITGLLVFAAALLVSYVVTRPSPNRPPPVLERIEDGAPSRTRLRSRILSAALVRAWPTLSDIPSEGPPRRYIAGSSLTNPRLERSTGRASARPDPM